MSLNLPELGLDVLEVTFSGLYIQLIERSKDRNHFYLPISFEMSFKTHMIVLSDSFLNSVPEPNSPDQTITQRIIRERKSNTTACD